MRVVDRVWCRVLVVGCEYGDIAPWCRRYIHHAVDCTRPEVLSHCCLTCARFTQSPHLSYSPGESFTPSHVHLPYNAQTPPVRVTTLLLQPMGHILTSKWTHVLNFYGQMSRISTVIVQTHTGTVAHIRSAALPGPPKLSAMIALVDVLWVVASVPCRIACWWIIPSEIGPVISLYLETRKSDDCREWVKLCGSGGELRSRKSK